MRALLLFVIGIFFGTGLGFLIAGGLGETQAHDHGGHEDAEGHDAIALTPWQGDPPNLDLTLTRDMGLGLNVRIEADGFIFDPDAVNTPTTAGTGHAHIYVNGEKVARAYGPYNFISDVPAGAVVRVTLNTNEHGSWGIDGRLIAAEAIAP